MNKSIPALIVALFICTGVLAYTTVHKAPTVQVEQQPVLGASGTEHSNIENFYNGLTFGAAVKSSSTPAALGAVPSFFMTASTTSQTASSTMIRSLNSMVFWEFASTTPIAGTTCNSGGAPATSTVTVYASSTNPSQNGFVLKLSGAPSGATTPYCLSGFILPQ